MRFARWLLPAAILAILVLVGMTFSKRQDAIAKSAPARPRPLEAGLDGRSDHWCYSENDGDKPKIKLCAKSQRQVREPSVWEFEGVELQLFRDHATVYDLITSDKAEFDMAKKTLFSDGDVEITRGVPAEGEPPAGRLVKIRTSGVLYSSDTGKAITDRHADFDFDRGKGSATGVEYDPKIGELLLKNNVSLDLRSKNATAPPMHVEAAEGVYLEHKGKVALHKWSKLTRGALHVDAGMSTVTLDQGDVKLIEAQNATGVQDDPGRKVEFAADELALQFAEGGTIHTAEGRAHTRLVSTVPAEKTTVTGDRIDLAFTPSDHESVLTSAVSAGGSVAHSEPIPVPGVDPPDTRILKSDIIRLDMRPGGREIEKVETEGAGTLDFVPNRPGGSTRNLKGDRFWIAYGKANRIQSFRTVNATTTTVRPPEPGKPVAPPIVTSSKDFLATFEPEAGRLERIEQTTDFHYDEGDQHARGTRATLDQARNTMILEGGARVWDPTGSADADRIELDQKSGDYTAQGHVATTRQPDKKGASSAMLSNNDVMQARAQKLTSTGKNKHLLYEGSAVMWQGANRVEGDRINIDRDKGTLEAHGGVVSQFVDRSQQDQAKAKGKTAAPIFTVVRAPDMEYADETRLANYRGGTVLTRPGLTVNSRDLHAYLNDSSSDTSLDRALADGNVKIVSTSLDPGTKRTRTGTSDHSEYLAKDQKLTLEGGAPEMNDSLKGKTTGRQLTWFANNDRLLVDGEESKPAVTVIRKK